MDEDFIRELNRLADRFAIREKDNNTYGQQYRAEGGPVNIEMAERKFDIAETWGSAHEALTSLLSSYGYRSHK